MARCENFGSALWEPPLAPHCAVCSRRWGRGSNLITLFSVVSLLKREDPSCELRQGLVHNWPLQSIFSRKSISG